MAALSIQVPYPVFYDRDGQPLNNGNIYIGVANLDPVTNPLQVYYDDALTITASQPLKTSNGYVYRNGTPTQLYVDANDFSITVNDEKNLFIYSFPQGTGIGVNAAAITYNEGSPNAVDRTVASRLQDSISLKDFGAVGDDSTNDTAAIQNAAAVSPYYAPDGIYKSTAVNFAALSGRQYGNGQIRTADNNLSAPYFSVVSSAPSPLGNESSIATAFNGDLTGCQFAVSHTITGAATLGQPATGYLYRPEAMPYYTYLYNASGWNQGTADNVGRTGVAAYRTKVYQTGQGDAVCFNGSVTVTGTRAGSTHWLANPAGVLFNGDMAAAEDGVYLNAYETICYDEGFDVACVGLVNNFVRTNDTGDKSTVWIGYRAQSVGSAPCDNLISAVGKWQVGLDLAMTGTDFGTNQAAISLKAEQRIYFNNAALASGNLDADWRTTVFNGDYLTFDYTNQFIHFVRGGESKLQIGLTDVVVANAKLGVNTGIGGTTAFIQDRQLGFALPTGTTDTGTFDTATVTTQRLAEYVKGLVERLHAGTPGAHSLIGT